MAELTPSQELDFNIITGLLFSLSTTIEYIEEAKDVMDERGANYVRNKSAEAHMACSKLMSSLSHGLSQYFNADEQRIIQDNIAGHKDLVYKLFTLNETDQRRVKGLIDKLIKEK